MTVSDETNDESTHPAADGDGDVTKESISEERRWRPRRPHVLAALLVAALVVGGVWIGTASDDDGASADRVTTDRTEDAASRDHDRPEPTPTETEEPTEEPSTPEPKEAKPKPKPEPEPQSGPEVVIGPDCADFSGHQATACALLGDYGFGTDQMSCLVPLWEHESGWNPKAANPSSGAYGIPQSLPGSKMASAGADWQTNAATQIRWGLGYISGRYGSPCGAWNYWQGNGWY